MTETENKKPKVALLIDLMDCRFAELPPEIRDEMIKEYREELDFHRKLAEEAFIRKSRTLTVLNAGGVITVVAYLGTKLATLNCGIIFTLAAFFTGLILNLLVMFRAEWRYVKNKNDYQELTNKFMQADCTMTVKEYNQKCKDSEISIVGEDIGEGLSALAFIVGVSLAICSMLNAI